MSVQLLAIVRGKDGEQRGRMRSAWLIHPFFFFLVSFTPLFFSTLFCFALFLFALFSLRRRSPLPGLCDLVYQPLPLLQRNAPIS